MIYDSEVEELSENVTLELGWSWHPEQAKDVRPSTHWAVSGARYYDGRSKKE